ncbi:MAG: hypothetical protein LBM60_06410 [Clostridium sp.]|jgi:hypothetical protein|nr:hypothetical protein [Clostridium sp.]
MVESVVNRVRFKIGEIEFEAEGSAEVVERERSVFLNAILPAAVDAFVRTHGAEQAVQYIETSKQSTVLLPAEAEDMGRTECSVTTTPVDLPRTNLSAYIKDLGELTVQDFTLIAAYYDEKKNGVKSFTIDSVRQYFADARKGKPSNPSDILLKLAIKAYIMDDPEAEKKVPKSYILTNKGIKYVETYQPKEN